MGDYRHNRNVEEHHLENATSITFLHQARDLWQSPRGTVLRIQVLALAAIAISFFLATFGSCRRWSNRWIVQKGFLAAQVLSLSLGAYSIGLMQSTSVKSEMYPIWAVCIFTLFSCIDPVTSYNSLDYKAPFLKAIFQLCLYSAYVVLMSVSNISGIVGNLSIGVLSAITFIKGFHRSMALVLPSRIRNEPKECPCKETKALTSDDARHGNMGILVINDDIEDANLGYFLCGFTRWGFLGLDAAQKMDHKREAFSIELSHGRVINFKRTLKVIEVELAFLYEVCFTSNEFLYYREAKTCSFWALASCIGICLVGIVAAIPGTMASRYHIASAGPGAGTIVVATTTADFILTLVILVFLASLQLVQLIRCWASNWGRLTRIERGGPRLLSPWIRLKAFVVTRMNWFDKYLWQDKLGQYSLVTAHSFGEECCGSKWSAGIVPNRCYWARARLAGMLGLPYIGLVLKELWGSDNKGATIRLHDDVKTSIADFLGQIKRTRIGKEWSSLFVENGLDASQLPYSNAPLRTVDFRQEESSTYAFLYRVMVWHIATCYCELAEQEGGRGGGGGKNRRVAMDLSKYCVYLVVSAPELIPGLSVEAKRVFNKAASSTSSECKQLANENRSITTLPPRPQTNRTAVPASLLQLDIFSSGVYWGQRLRDEMPPDPGCMRQRNDDPWELLALLWVQTLLYAAPYGSMDAHRRHLSQGGQFITHLWALLYHIGIDKWEYEEEEEEEEEERIQEEHIQDEIV